LSLKVDNSHPVPDINAAFAIATNAPPGGLYGQLFGISVGLTYQFYQNGTLNLTSSNPLANTTFKPNLFLVNEDVQTLVKGIKKIREVMAFWTTATEVIPGPNITSDAALAALVRSNGSISGHFSGSVPMGLTDEYPVDLHWHVRGVNKLRVVDTSVMHAQISRGMQATAAMLGYKGATMIIKEWM